MLGSKIKALRAKTNTYIKTPVRGEEPVFVVTGRREDVAAAKREILSASEHFSQIRASRLSAGSASPGGVAGGGGGCGGRPVGQDTGGQVTIHVRVPYRVVGLVVGPKGATIKRIQQDSSTYIVTPSRDREPVFEVTGTCEGVEKARRDIESYIALRTGTAPDSAGPPPVAPLTGEQKDVDLRVLLSSLLKSATPGSSMLQNGTGISSSAAALLSYNNAVNLGRLATPPNSDILTNGASVGFGVGAGPLVLPQQHGANGFACDNVKPFPGLFDYECAALRPELLDEALSSDNNNVIVPSTPDAWSAANSMDMTPLSLRSLASLLPLDEFARIKYPLGVEMPSLDSLAVNYASQASAVLEGRQGDGCLGGFVSGSSDSGRSGSGSSPLATGSSAESAASPRRLQAAPAPTGCPCFLCTESPGLVPCGHSLFCKACVDAAVSRADLTERRCSVVASGPPSPSESFLSLPRQ